MIDYVVAPICFVLLAGYHCHLFYCKNNALRKLTATIRSQWVRQALRREKDKGSSTVPLNTLRNNISVVSGGQQSAMLICAATIGYAFNLKLNYADDKKHPGIDVVLIKLFGIIGTFGFSFLNFLQAQRYMAHLGFLLHVHTLDADQSLGSTFDDGNRMDGDDSVVRTVNPEVAEQFLARSYFHKFIGERCFFVAVPIAAWIFGPWWMLGSSIAVVVALQFLDTESLDTATMSESEYVNLDEESIDVEEGSRSEQDLEAALEGGGETVAARRAQVAAVLTDADREVEMEMRQQPHRPSAGTVGVAP